MAQTLEESAENYNDDFQIKGGSKAPHIKNVHIMNHFIAGAKWQQEQDKNKYSGEEVFELLCTMPNFFSLSIAQQILARKAWFEQFKKK